LRLQRHRVARHRLRILLVVLVLPQHRLAESVASAAPRGRIVQHAKQYRPNSYNACAEHKDYSAHLVPREGHLLIKRPLGVKKPPSLASIDSMLSHAKLIS
jgi:hypothetical protein